MLGFFQPGEDPVAPDTLPPNYEEQAKQAAAGLEAAGFWAGLLGKIGVGVYVAFAYLMRIVAVILATVLDTMTRIMALVEGETNPQFRAFEADLLTDLLGVPIDKDLLLRRSGDRGRLGAMNVLGGSLLDTLVNEFVSPEARGGAGIGTVTGAGAPGQPGEQRLTPEQGRIAANRFLGFVLNFSAKAGVMAFASELATLGLVENGREIAEAFARNLGLGRMVRQALRPVFGQLITEPYTWWINEQYRPTVLGEAGALKAYAQGRITLARLQTMLARRGYSNELINLMADEAIKKLPESDLLRMWRWGNLSETQVIERMQRMGYSRDEAVLSFSADKTSRLETRQEAVISLYRQQCLDGWITPQQLSYQLQRLNLTDDEQTWIRRIVGDELEVPARRVTLSQMENMVLEGVCNLADYREFLVQARYSTVDAANLVTMLGLKLTDKAAAEKAAQDKAALAAANAQAAALAKIAAGITGGTATPTTKLTYSQWRNAYIYGFATRDEWTTYLTDAGYSIRDREILVADADIDVAALADAQAQADALAFEDPPKALSLSEVEEAFVAGVIDRDVYVAHVAAAGYSDEDAAILTANADRLRAAADAKAAAAAAPPPGPPPRILTLAQETAAFVAGAVTADEFRAYLTAQNYAPEASAVLFDEADVHRQQHIADAARAAELAAAAPKPKLSLAEQRSAYLAGLLTEQQFAYWLDSDGYNADEITILVALANRERDKSVAAAAAATAAGVIAPSRPLSRSDAEAAFVGGLTTAAAYKDFLQGQGYAPADVEILAAIAARRRTEAEGTAAAAAAKAAAPLPTRLTVSQLETAVADGILTLTEYDQLLAERGFGSRDRDILTTALSIKLSSSPAPPETP